MKKIVYIGAIIGLLCAAASCARLPSVPAGRHASTILFPVPQQTARQDIFHVVAPGETLWRVAKMYHVSIEKIMHANTLKTTILEKGQRLLVPGAAPLAPVITLCPSNKWKYIIIHHSATEEGCSYDFDKYHIAKGWECVGYHFVIDNGSKGKQDGQIEVSPRWLKQKNGAHCSAGAMNEQGIGICLVGDLNSSFVSWRQMQALVYLTNTLRTYYKIPLQRILGHGQVQGAQTDCPGKKFSWTEFKRRLAQ